MDNNKKKQLLEYILNSEKINDKYLKLKYKYKLDKKQVAKKIINDSTLLWKKTKDLNKIKNFLESYIYTHMKDFLILRNTDNHSQGTNVSISNLNDSRVDEDPSDRLQREIQERRQLNMEIHLNEENTEEKNEINNLDTEDMNRNNYNPYLNNQMNQIPKNRRNDVNYLPMNSSYMMNEQMNGQMMNSQMMNSQMMNSQMMNTQINGQPMINRQPIVNNRQSINDHQHSMNIQQSTMNNRHPIKNNRQNVVNEQFMDSQMNEFLMNGQQPLVMNGQQPLVMNGQQPLVMNGQQPLMNSQQSLMNSQQSLMNSQQPLVNDQKQSVTEEVRDDKLVKSLIHIDSRERNFNEVTKSNPFCIVMNNETTCLVCVKDLILNNIHNDPYLLVQLLESPKGAYENQLGKEIHFKLVKTETNKENSYYKNIDTETMIRLRNINRITFNVIRPNGKPIYLNTDDVTNINVYDKEECMKYIENSNILSSFNDSISLIKVDNLNNLMLEVGDLISLFDDDLEEGNEFRVLDINKLDNKILLECLDKKVETNYCRMLINKYQISITLEII